jgi:photosystem II stability/assembly factor-like uncharacterized protein
MRRRCAGLAPEVVVTIALIVSACGPAPTRSSVDSTAADRTPIDWLWPRPAGTQLDAIAINNSNSGSVVVAGTFGSLFVTLDEGRSWVAAPIPPDRSLRAAVWASDQHAVVVGDAATMIESRDGGASWSAREVPASGDLRAVAFDGRNLGLVAGAEGTLLRTEDAGATWQAVASATTATLRSVALANDTVAVAVGDGGAIIRSDDQGRTWRPVESGATATLRAVAFDESGTGVAVGGDDRRVRARRIILRTADAGLTWQRADAPSGGRLYGVSAAAGAFIAVGEAGCVLTSFDDGRSWRSASIVEDAAPCPTESTSGDRAPWLSSIAAAQSRLAAVGDGGRIFWSADGRTWQGRPALAVPNLAVAPVAAVADAVVIAHGTAMFRSESGGPFERVDRPGDFNVLAIRFIDDRLGVATGANGGILRTTDGGRTWSAVVSPTRRYLRDVAFATASDGIAVGGESGQGDGVILTFDGGLTWEAQSCPSATAFCASREPLEAVDMLPSGAGMAVGPRIVLATTDGGRTWIEREQRLAFVTLTDVAVLDDRTAVVTGASGTILRTTDAGASWTRVPSRTRVRLMSVAFADADRGLIVGGGGVVLATWDGGRTWRQDPVRVPATLVDLHIDRAGTALVAGTQNVVIRRPWTASRD